jgi:hypothetical protein
MKISFGFVVEGHGEVDAVPSLVRRIVFHQDPRIEVPPAKPVRIPKSKLLVKGELERAVRLALLNNNRQGPVIVIIDADDHCPAELGPSLKLRATSVANGLPVSVILPQREFETWFLTAAASLGGKRGLIPDITPPDNPESIQGAKEWLRRHMTEGRTYSETLDQAALVHAMDFQQARRSRSFDRCWREVARVCKEMMPDVTEG